VSTLWVSDCVELGSYRAGFRMFLDVPVFARAGVRFEPHLGHVFSLFRGL